MAIAFNPALSTDLNLYNTHYLSVRPDGSMHVRPKDRGAWFCRAPEERVEAVRQAFVQHMAALPLNPAATVQDYINFYRHAQRFNRRVIESHNESWKTFFISWILFWKQIKVEPINPAVLHQTLLDRLQVNHGPTKLTAIENVLRFRNLTDYIHTDRVLLDTCSQHLHNIFSNLLNPNDQSYDFARDLPQLTRIMALLRVPILQSIFQTLKDDHQQASQGYLIWTNRLGELRGKLINATPQILNEEEIIAPYGKFIAKMPQCKLKQDLNKQLCEFLNWGFQQIEQSVCIACIYSTM